LKRNLALLLAAALCLSLAACTGGKSDAPVVGNDWRVTGVVSDSGTITRDGETVDVLVCVHASDAALYYDTAEQTLFGSVDYPVTLETDAAAAYRSIGFADRSGDGNGDVTMLFDDGGRELTMVWYWDAESGQFVYDPLESQLGEDEAIPEDDGRGDLIEEESAAPPVLMGGALPFTGMVNLLTETNEDGTYTYMDMTEDGLTVVVNTAMLSGCVYDVQTIEDYLSACALEMSDALTYDALTIEQNMAYTEQMTYPVYIVTYIAGENEDSREWTVYAMDTDCLTYLYGFGTTLDAAEDVRDIYPDIFAGLYLSDGE
ncbi:MAG: hypothetical protein ACI4XW_11495, partial [Candidatus Spyradocola sp.]